MLNILIVVTPNFNIAATTAFIDPFRAANYLEGDNQFKWTVASSESQCMSSNGLLLNTAEFHAVQNNTYDMVVVSSSWTPEKAAKPQLLSALRKWSRNGSMIGALDTGAFILAQVGLLSGRRATVHYEHIDALKELYQDIQVVEDIFVRDDKVFTCSGGIASSDMALQIIASSLGQSAANAAARYIFHPKVRPVGTLQNPGDSESSGNSVPDPVRRAIVLMEQNLEDALRISEICKRLNVSNRHLDRLFERYVRRSPAIYYRDIRLDRARGLVTQTDMLLSEIAIASGFASQVHFSRAYRERFGLPPSKDRIEGRIPFEFRAWPMHRREQKR